MFDRLEEKTSRSLMKICNVFYFREPDCWRKRIVCSQFVSIVNSFLGTCLRERLITCSILKSHRRNSKAHGVINLEMAKILKEKGFSDVLPGQKLRRQCVTEYEKLTKPPENENMTEIIDTDSSKDELASDDHFLLYESLKK